MSRTASSKRQRAPRSTIASAGKPEPEDADPKFARRLKRAIVAMGQTSVRNQFAHIENVLDTYDRSLAEWIRDRDRFDALDAEGYKLVSYAYGYIMGIADAHHVSSSLLAQVFEQTCDRCGKHVERLIPVIVNGSKPIDLCRTCIILGGK